MSQVFWNFICNLFCVMFVGGMICVCGQFDDEVYCIFYLDIGCGMSEEECVNFFYFF